MLRVSHCSSPQIPTAGMTMRALIDLLPHAYRQAVGNVYIPPDDGLALAQVLMSKNMSYAWAKQHMPTHSERGVMIKQNAL